MGHWAQIQKKDETMWRPAQWKQLQRKGRDLLDVLSHNRDTDTLRQVLGQDYQAIDDAVRKPRPAQPPEEPNSADGSDIEEESTDEDVGTGVDEGGAEGDENPEGHGGEAASVKTEQETPILKERAATTPKAVNTRRVAEDADSDTVEPPSKRQKTA